jgi:hypothetical protein
MYPEHCFLVFIKIFTVSTDLKYLHNGVLNIGHWTLKGLYWKRPTFFLLLSFLAPRRHSPVSPHRQDVLDTREKKD